MLLQNLDLRSVVVFVALAFTSLGFMLSSQSAAAGLSAQDRQRLLASPRIAAEVIFAIDAAEEAQVLILFEVFDAGAEPRARRAARRRGDVRAMISSSERAAMRQRRRAMLERFAPGEFQLRHQYSSVNLLAGALSPQGLMRLLDDPRVKRVDLDRGGSGGLVEAKNLSGFTSVAQAGWTGAGVQVAVIDSGVDGFHSDLSNAIVDEA
jgi:subtilisin family serine protease